MNKIAVTILISFATLSVYADTGTPLCQSELLGANQILSQGGTLTEPQKKQLQTCLNIPNACASSYPELKYNCHYIRNIVNTVTASTETVATPVTPPISAPVSAPKISKQVAQPNLLPKQPSTQPNNNKQPINNQNNKPQSPSINWF